jgi:DNA-binding CsgD family transcriptional regulator
MKSAPQPFTERQREILALMSAGMNSNQVAAALNIRPRTIWSQTERARLRHKVFTNGELLEKYQRWAGLPINPNGLRYTVR